MAKRTPNRTTAEDSGAATSPQQKPRRPRTVAPTLPESGATPAAQAREQEPAATPSHQQQAQRQNNGADIPSEAGDDAPLESMASRSMGSEPSEEDIRLRAYHRYLERGGGHGMDFEDWLEAERELKIR
jgi:hypothetical protein